MAVGWLCFFNIDNIYIYMYDYICFCSCWFGLFRLFSPFFGEFGVAFPVMRVSVSQFQWCRDQNGALKEKHTEVGVVLPSNK